MMSGLRRPLLSPPRSVISQATQRIMPLSAPQWIRPSTDLSRGGSLLHSRTTIESRLSTTNAPLNGTRISSSLSRPLDNAAASTRSRSSSEEDPDMVRSRLENLREFRESRDTSRVNAAAAVTGTVRTSMQMYPPHLGGGPLRRGAHVNSETAILMDSGCGPHSLLHQDTLPALSNATPTQISLRTATSDAEPLHALRGDVHLLVQAESGRDVLIHLRSAMVGGRGGAKGLICLHDLVLQKYVIEHKEDKALLHTPDGSETLVLPCINGMYTLGPAFAVDRSTASTSPLEATPMRGQLEDEVLRGSHQPIKSINATRPTSLQAGSGTLSRESTTGVSRPVVSAMSTAKTSYVCSTNEVADAMPSPSSNLDTWREQMEKELRPVPPTATPFAFAPPKLSFAFTDPPVCAPVPLQEMELEELIEETSNPPRPGTKAHRRGVREPTKYKDHLDKMDDI